MTSIGGGLGSHSGGGYKPPEDLNAGNAEDSVQLNQPYTFTFQPYEDKGDNIEGKGDPIPVEVELLSSSNGKFTLLINVKDHEYKVTIHQELSSLSKGNLAYRAKQALKMVYAIGGQDEEKISFKVQGGLLQDNLLTTEQKETWESRKTSIQAEKRKHPGETKKVEELVSDTYKRIFTDKSLSFSNDEAHIHRINSDDEIDILRTYGNNGDIELQTSNDIDPSIQNEVNQLQQELVSSLNALYDVVLNNYEKVDSSLKALQDQLEKVKNYRIEKKGSLTQRQENLLKRTIQAVGEQLKNIQKKAHAIGSIPKENWKSLASCIDTFNKSFNYETKDLKSRYKVFSELDDVLIKLIKTNPSLEDLTTRVQHRVSYDNCKKYYIEGAKAKEFQLKGVQALSKALVKDSKGFYEAFKKEMNISNYSLSSLERLEEGKFTLLNDLDVFAGNLGVYIVVLVDYNEKFENEEVSKDIEEITKCKNDIDSFLKEVKAIKKSLGANSEKYESFMQALREKLKTKASEDVKKLSSLTSELDKAGDFSDLLSLLKQAEGLSNIEGKDDLIQKIKEKIKKAIPYPQASNSFDDLQKTIRTLLNQYGQVENSEVSKASKNELQSTIKSYLKEGVEHLNSNKGDEEIDSDVLEGLTRLGLDVEPLKKATIKVKVLKEAEALLLERLTTAISEAEKLNTETSVDTEFINRYIPLFKEYRELESTELKENHKDEWERFVGLINTLSEKIKESLDINNEEDFKRKIQALIGALKSNGLKFDDLTVVFPFKEIQDLIDDFLKKGGDRLSWFDKFLSTEVAKLQRSYADAINKHLKNLAAGFDAKHVESDIESILSDGSYTYKVDIPEESKGEVKAIFKKTFEECQKNLVNNLQNKESLKAWISKTTSLIEYFHHKKFKNPDIDTVIHLQNFLDSYAKVEKAPEIFHEALIKKMKTSTDRKVDGLNSIVATVQEAFSQKIKGLEEKSQALIQNYQESLSEEDKGTIDPLELDYIFGFSEESLTKIKTEIEQQYSKVQDHFVLGGYFKDAHSKIKQMQEMMQEIKDAKSITFKKEGIEKYAQAICVSYRIKDIKKASLENIVKKETASLNLDAIDSKVETNLANLEKKLNEIKGKYKGKIDGSDGDAIGLEKLYEWSGESFEDDIEFGGMTDALVEKFIIQLDEKQGKKATQLEENLKQYTSLLGSRSSIQNLIISKIKDNFDKRQLQNQGIKEILEKIVSIGKDSSVVLEQSSEEPIDEVILDTQKSKLNELKKQLSEFSLQDANKDELNERINKGINQVDSCAKTLVGGRFEDADGSIKKGIIEIYTKLSSLQTTKELLESNLERIKTSALNLKKTLEQETYLQFIDKNTAFERINFHLPELLADLDENQTVFLKKELSKAYFSQDNFSDYIKKYVQGYFEKYLKIENGEIKFDGKTFSEKDFLEKLDEYYKRLLDFSHKCIGNIDLGTSIDRTSLEKDLYESLIVPVRDSYSSFYSQKLQDVKSKITNGDSIKFSVKLHDCSELLTKYTVLYKDSSKENAEKKIEEIYSQLHENPEAMREFYETINTLSSIGDRGSDEVYNRVLSTLRGKLIEHNILSLIDPFPPVEGLIKIFFSEITRPLNAIDSLITERYGKEAVYDKKVKMLENLNMLLGKGLGSSSSKSVFFIHNHDSQSDFLKKADNYMKARSEALKKPPIDKAKLLRSIFPGKNYGDGVTVKAGDNSYLFQCDQEGRIYTEKDDDRYYLDPYCLLSDPGKDLGGGDKTYLPLRREGSSSSYIFSWDVFTIEWTSLGGEVSRDSEAVAGVSFDANHSTLPYKSEEKEYQLFSEKKQALQDKLSELSEDLKTSPSKENPLKIETLDVGDALEAAYTSEYRGYLQKKRDKIDRLKKYKCEFPSDKKVEEAIKFQTELFNSIEDFYHTCQVELLLAEDKIKTLIKSEGSSVTSIEDIIGQWKKGEVPKEWEPESAKIISQYIVLRHFCSTFLPLHRKVRRLRVESFNVSNSQESNKDQQIEAFNLKLRDFVTEVDARFTRFNALQSFDENKLRSRMVFELLDDISLRDDQSSLHDEHIYNSLKEHFREPSKKSNPWKKICKLGTGYGKSTMIKLFEDLVSECIGKEERAIVVMAPHENQGELNRQIDRYRRSIDPSLLPIKLNFLNWNADDWTVDKLKAIQGEINKAVKEKTRRSICLSIEDRAVLSFMRKACKENPELYEILDGIYNTVKEGFKLFDEIDTQDKFGRKRAEEVSKKIHEITKDSTFFQATEPSVEEVVLDQKSFMRASKYVLGFSATIESIGSTCSMLGKKDYNKAYSEGMIVDELTTTFRGVDWVRHAEVKYPMDTDVENKTFQKGAIIESIKKGLEDNSKSDFIIQDSHGVFEGKKEEIAKELFDLRREHIQNQIINLLVPHKSKISFDQFTEHSWDAFSTDYCLKLDDDKKEQVKALFRKHYRTKIIYQDKDINGQMVLHAYDGTSCLPITDKDLAIYRSRGGLDLCYYLAREGEVGVDVPQDWEESLSLERGCHTLITTGFCSLKRQLQRMGRARQMDKGQKQQMVLSQKEHYYLKEKYKQVKNESGAELSINEMIALEMLELQIDDESLENDRLSCMAMVSKYLEDIERQVNESHHVGKSLFEQGIVESLKAYIIENDKGTKEITSQVLFEFLQNKANRQAFIESETKKIELQGSIHSLRKKSSDLYNLDNKEILSINSKELARVLSCLDTDPHVDRVNNLKADPRIKNIIRNYILTHSEGFVYLDKSTKDRSDINTNNLTRHVPNLEDEISKAIASLKEKEDASIEELGKAENYSDFQTIGIKKMKEKFISDFQEYMVDHLHQNLSKGEITTVPESRGNLFKRRKMTMNPCVLLLEHYRVKPRNTVPNNVFDGIINAAIKQAISEKTSLLQDNKYTSAKGENKGEEALPFGYNDDLEKFASVFPKILCDEFIKRYGIDSSEDIGIAFENLIKYMNTLIEAARAASIIDKSWLQTKGTTIGAQQVCSRFSCAKWDKYPAEGSMNIDLPSTEISKKHKQNLTVFQIEVSKYLPVSLSSSGTEESPWRRDEQEKIDVAFRLYEEQQGIFEQLEEKRRQAHDSVEERIKEDITTAAALKDIINSDHDSSNA